MKSSAGDGNVTRGDLDGGSDGEDEVRVGAGDDTGVGVSTEEGKIMTNNTNNTSADISLNSQKIQEVPISSFN